MTRIQMTFTVPDIGAGVGDNAVVSDMVVSVDYVKVAEHLAHQATFSKGKKATAMAGAIVVKATSTRRKR